MITYEELKNKYEWFDFVCYRYMKKFEGSTPEDFLENLEKYNQIPIFKANENIHQIMTDYSDRDSLPDIEEKFVKSTDIVTEKSHFIMRLIVQYYITKAFDAMKIDMEDPNVKENVLTKSTPGRIAKLWCGDNPEDTTEIGSARWNKEVYVSCFPNVDDVHEVVVKETDLVSCCSHHFLPFTTLGGGKVTIAYIPNKFVIGLSKLSRYVNFCARRFWLQEQLTNYIGKELVRIADTENMYVRIENAKHDCERLRGANSVGSALTTEFKSGCFKTNPELIPN